MADLPASPEGDSTTKTATDNINELLEIDKDVAEILKTAGLAIKDLTNGSVSMNEGVSSDAALNNGDRTIESSKKAFEGHTTSYFTLVQTLSERLQRQVHALEKAGIISPESHAAEAQPLPPPPPPVTARSGQAPVKSEPPMQITNGGMGNLDVGWLNSRRDLVGKQKEAELWAEAKRHLQTIQGTGGRANEMESHKDAGSS